MPNCDYRRESLTTIVALAQNMDVKAIEALIRREQRHIYAIFSHLIGEKEDVADLTQDALVKMAKNIKSLKSPEHFRQWLNRIISNTFYDYTRKHGPKYAEADEDRLNEIKDNTLCEPGEKCVFSELERLLRKALIALPKNLRLSIILREYEGLSYEDISKVMNTTIGTVKSRISRARLRLRETLSDFI